MKCKVFSLIVLLLAVTSTAALGEPIVKNIYFAKRTNLTAGRTYRFRFSLWTVAEGGDQATDEIWSEVKRKEVPDNTVIKHYLGSVDPVGNPLDAEDFSQQLWVQLDRWSRGESSYVMVGNKRTRLRVAPYALYSETTYDSVDSGSIEDGSITAVDLEDGAALAEIMDDDGSGSGLDADLLDGQDSTEFASSGDLTAHAGNASAHHARYADAEAVAAIKAADGAGSGLDADLLDGQDGSYYRAWNNLTGVPPGFADDTDNDTTYTAGAGLTLAADEFSVNFAGSGAALTSSRSDHDHNAAYYTEAESDANFVDAAGDTMTGDLTVDATGMKMVSKATADDETAGNTSKLEVQDSTGTAIFSVDSEGDVTANSFTGDGSNLTGISADDANTLDGLDSTDFAAVGDFTAHAGNASAHHARYADAEAVAAIKAADGAGSGLDADLLDGQDGSYYRAWNNLTGVPPGFADDTDNDTTYTAGAGLTLAADEFSVNFAGGGAAATASRSDHDHNASYYTEAESDGNFVDASGDTMTGDLTVDATGMKLASRASADDETAADVSKLEVQDSTGTAIFSVDSEGDVAANSMGIGISTPADPLHIVADAGGDNIHLEENSGGEDWQIGIDSSGNLNLEDSGTRRIAFQDGTGRMYIGTGTPEWLGTGLHVETADCCNSSFSNYDEAVFENTGNVGITLLTSAAVGGYCFGGYTNCYAAMDQPTCDASYGGDVYVEDSLVSLVYYEFYNREMGFYVNNAVRMVIEDTGEVGIGTQSPAYQLELSTDSAGKLSTNTWTVTSDERVKTNIADFDDGLDVVMQLRPVTYEYNGLGGYIEDGKMKVGFIAQELEPVAPYMVGKVKKILNPGDEEETDLLNYNGHALAFVTVNAVQEQQEQIQLLKEENGMLKAELCERDPSYSWCP